MAQNVDYTALQDLNLVALREKYPAGVLPEVMALGKEGLGEEQRRELAVAINVRVGDPDTLVSLLGADMARPPFYPDPRTAAHSTDETIDAFIGKLDSLFTADSKLEGESTSVDISGLIGQYAHGNEPSHHIAHLYNYVGQPWRTQEIVDEVLHTLYFNNPDGLSGNEDCGQMSAWYILNAMGFYQVCPGKPVYSIGRPLFNEATVHLKDGKSFKVIAHNNSRDNKYVRSIVLNGNKLETPFFTHQDIVDGGTLELTMGSEPLK